MISAVILTKNDEMDIVDCLESVSWIDEIIIIDDYSDDRTLEVVKNNEISGKIKIYQNKLNQDFAEQRNFGLTKTTKDWVLFLDADERITKELRSELNEVLIEEKNKTKNIGFMIPRKDMMWGKLLKFGESGNIKLLRLAKRNAGEWVGKVHEEWIVDGNVSELENFIIHFPHKTINEFLKEINFYTTIRAKELYEKGKKSSLFQIIFYPKAKFVINYFLKLGILDGLEGLVFAILMSFHSFLVRGKLWLLWGKR